LGQLVGASLSNMPPRDGRLTEWGTASTTRARTVSQCDSARQTKEAPAAGPKSNRRPTPSTEPPPRPKPSTQPSSEHLGKERRARTERATRACGAASGSICMGLPGVNAILGAPLALLSRRPGISWPLFMAALLLALKEVIHAGATGAGWMNQRWRCKSGLASPVSDLEERKNPRLRRISTSAHRD
jgi:hypothetical protein